MPRALSFKDSGFAIRLHCMVVSIWTCLVSFLFSLSLALDFSLVINVNSIADGMLAIYRAIKLFGNPNIFNQNVLLVMDGLN